MTAQQFEAFKRRILRVTDSDIQKPDEIPLGQLLALAAPTHPDLARQLQEVIGRQL